MNSFPFIVASAAGAQGLDPARILGEALDAPPRAEEHVDGAHYFAVSACARRHLGGPRAQRLLRR